MSYTKCALQLKDQESSELLLANIAAMIELALCKDMHHGSNCMAMNGDNSNSKTRYYLIPNISYGFQFKQFKGSSLL